MTEQERKAYRKSNINGIITLAVIILLMAGCWHALNVWHDGNVSAGRAYGGSHPDDNTH